MKKIFGLLIRTVLTLIVGCNDQADTNTTIAPQYSIETVFEEYHQQRLTFNPLEATRAGKEGYNDKLPNLFSQSYELAETLVFERDEEGNISQYKNHGNFTKRIISR